MGCTVTIREHFRRRFNRIKYGFTVVAIVLAGVLVWRYPHQTPEQYLTYGVVLGIPLALVLRWLLRGRFLCPRCGTDLQKLRVEQRRQARRERGQLGYFNVDAQPFYETWDACPRCGCSFDDPYPLARR
jgi:hypothetical protein